jgi:hypothetical protein
MVLLVALSANGRDLGIVPALREPADTGEVLDDPAGVEETMPTHDISPEHQRFSSLLDRGLGRNKAARLVEAEASDGASGIGEPEGYGDWTDEELYRRAGELGVEDRYGMGRDELIAAIRAQ